MKVKRLYLAITAHLVCLVATQNDRSYDTNDWIPVTQKPGEEIIQKKAQGRVLNLDTPSQKFFPDELNYKKGRPNFQSRPKQKDRYNVPKYESTYKFELPPSLPQNGSPKFPYHPKQGEQIYRPPPPQSQYFQNSQTIVRDRLPSSNVLNNIPQLTIPVNNDSNYYQAFNPVSINQELSGNVQFQDMNIPNIQYQSPSGAGFQYQRPETVNQHNKIYQNSNGGAEGTYANFNRALQQSKQVLGENTKTDFGIEKEAVQLVYVPLENLKENSRLVPQDSQTIYKQIESPKYDNQPDKQHRLAAIEQDFIQQALQATKLQEQIHHGDSFLFQTTTTPKPIQKRKPHQPPLAVYVEGEKQQVAISDVLEALKDAKSIAVQDSIQHDSPQIFIGPSTLESSEYSKFPLPYLNAIDGSRLNRNIESLPFFVAPLSFKAPPGFSKIPLPAPHVGSVVISNKDELQGKRSTIKPNQYSNSNVEQIVKDVSSTTTSKPKNSYDSLNIQPYIGQSYYQPVQFVSSPQQQFSSPQEQFTSPQAQFPLPQEKFPSPQQQFPSPQQQFPSPQQQFPSPQPQLLHFAVNENQQEFSIPNSSYNKKSQKTEYTQPMKSFSNNLDNLNRKHPTKRPFQYAYIDEIATVTTPSSNGDIYSQLRPSENVEYDVPDRNPSYLSSQPVFDQERISTPAYTQQYTDNKNSAKNTNRYEPIATSFEDATQDQQEEIVNIKPKTETVTQLPSRQKTVTHSSENKQKGRLPDVNPLELAINEFELHEINTQLEEKPRIKNQNNYKTGQHDEDTDYRYENNYRSRPTQNDEQEYKYLRNQSKQRIRPSQEDENTEYKFDPELHRFSSTPLSILRDSYVETTTKPSSKSRGRVRTRPTTTTTSTTTTPQPEEHYTVLEEFHVRDKSTPQYKKPTNTYYDVQTDVEIEPISNEKPSVTQYSDSITEIENIPTNVYSLNSNQNSYTDKIPVEQHSHILNQNLMDSQILNNQRTTPKYEQQGQFEVDPYTNQYIPTSQGKYKEEQQEQYEEKPIHHLTPFDDPSVRSLLIPNLLVPTTTANSIYTGPSYLPTTEKIISTTTTTTTEKPIESTTAHHSRTRSRTRGGSRYSDSSTTRRPVSRRRPTSARVTTERTRYPIDVDYSTKSYSTKQRFRTRGHTTPNSITERISTTENEVHQVPISATPITLRTHPDVSVTYQQYEQIDQKSEKPVLSDEYPKIRITTAQPILQYENTASSPKPVINVQVTHPAETYRYEQEQVPKVKVRGRIRDRPRITSTTTEKVTRKVTTPKPIEKEESSEDFFGFFRQPNFGPPPTLKKEIVTTPASPRIFTYQTPSQHKEDYEVPVTIDSSTVKFVGELIPKYTSREVETETPRPRIRARTRANVRKPVSHQDRSEQATRRNINSRSRGKTHYRIPENLKKNVDEEAEVEGGNYPQFFQEKRGTTTPRPEFQITVAPEEYEEDQAPHSSIKRLNVVASPENWHDAFLSDNISDDKTHGNIIKKPEDLPSMEPLPEQPTFPDQPYALPIKASSEEITTENIDENFKNTSKQIEEKFDAINSFDNQSVKDTNKKKRRKGVWKLVKQRPVDKLETSESQNYFSVLNSFNNIEKVNYEQKHNNYQKPNYIHLERQSISNPEIKTDDNDTISADIEVENETTTNDLFTDYTVTNQNDNREAYSTMPTYTDKESTTEYITQETTTKNIDNDFVTNYDKIGTITTTPTTEDFTKGEEDFIDSIYEMFGMARDISTTVPPTTSTEIEINSESVVTTTSNPTFPEELTEASSPTINVTESSTEFTTLQEFPTTLPVVEEKREKKTFPFQVEPWDMKLVRTSTSTEVSHETEICYRGRCVRSPDRKKRF
ncbi:uncharacterized protein LOC130894371 [Diorhabda carinulata]|uniref:uncharacterized protein LOC130894371 n=1 Tax=Diorhabda carinulata TaxID=1163345 RepID=UPI00259FF452|nr:uncharacterized protein LOC130894371 [Diorhabda carinulata]